MTERIEKLKTFLAENPHDPFLNHALGLEFVKEGDDLAACFYFNKNHEVSPDYVATYYHYAKTLERMGHKERALGLYEEGMAAAKKMGDRHTFNELQNAYDELDD